MPKPKDPTKYTDSQKIEVITKKRLQTQVDAEQERDKHKDLIRFRMERGQKDKIRDFVLTLPEYTHRSDSVRSKRKGEIVPNVNQWLADLVLAALPPEYIVLPEDKKDDTIE